jgi:hypothetical protein
MESNYVGREKVYGLSKHRGFRLDSTDPPTNHTETIDHRGVRVGSDESIREIDTFFLQYALRQILKVYLMADSESRWNDTEGLKRLFAPLEELVARFVALKLHLHVPLKRVISMREIDLNRVVDNKVDWDEWLNDAGIFSESLNRGSHRGEINAERHAREILKQHSRYDERNLGGALRLRTPRGQLPYASLLNSLSVIVAKH